MAYGNYDNNPDGWANYFANLAAMLAAAAIVFSFYMVGMALSCAPCAIGFGIWSRHKGSRAWTGWAGIIGGVVALVIVCVNIYLALSGVTA